MIVNKGRYYLYRHIRDDKQEVFYVGYGTKRGRKPKSITDSYSRALDKSLRSLSWKNIVAKTTYTIEIILESDDKSFIHTKEKEFIKMYGRKDLKKGTLVNFTDGGDGNQGYKLSEEHKKKISIQQLGRKHTEESKKKMSENMKGIKKSPEHIEKLKQNCYKVKPTEKSRVTIYQYSMTGDFIRECASATDIAREMGWKCPSGITNVCKKNKPSRYGFKWSYIKTDKL